MEVRGDYSRAVVYVNHVAGQEEIVDERDDTAIGRAYRLTDRASEIDAEVSRGERAVEQPAGSEVAVRSAAANS